MRRIAGFCAVLPMLAGPLVQARTVAATSEFLPAEAWSFEKTDESCSLLRSFVSDRGLVQLRISAMNSSGNLEMSVWSGDLSLDGGGMTVRVEPDDGSREVQGEYFGNYRTASRGVRFSSSLMPSSLVDLPRSEHWTGWGSAQGVDRERNITGLTIASAFTVPVSLVTGPLNVEMQQMRQCVRELQTSWGIDPALNDSVAVPAQPIDQDRWVRYVFQTYPPAMGLRRVSAVVHVTIIIGVDGRVRQCHAFNSQHHSQFDEAACGALEQHAQYEPARDAAGSPVPFIDNFTVNYSID